MAGVNVALSIFWFTSRAICIHSEVAAGCNEGLVSLLDVETEVANVVVVDNRLFIFPNLNFTCEARIVQWRFLAQVENDIVLPSRDLPEMQVWRAGNDRYTLCFSTDDDSALNISVEDTASNRSLVQYTLSEGAVVQAGDVFGMRIPGGTSVPRFHPLFLDLGDGNATTYLFLEGKATQQSFLFSSLTPEGKYAPVVSVEYAYGQWVTGIYTCMQPAFICINYVIVYDTTEHAWY